MGVYLGYRIKINGEVFKNGWIAKGSYHCKIKEKRILDEFFDANGKRHLVKSGHERTEIVFSVRKHKQEEHREIVEFFKEKEDIEVVYWNDEKLQYETGLFCIDSIEYVHENARNKEILYGEIQVSMTEN